MEEEYYPKTKTEVVLKAFQLIEKTLELNNFHLVHPGTWFFSESDDSVGIKFEYHPDNFHILPNTTA
jgi:hypothetical protein